MMDGDDTITVDGQSAATSLTVNDGVGADSFQVTASGKILRKRKGKRHCAFAKTPKQRMHLRSTTLVHASLVQNMRKLGFKMR